MFGFPLLLIPLAICNIIVFLMPGVSFAAPLVTLPLMSGMAWTVTLSDALLAFGVLMLMFEVIKGARPNGKYFTDHFLALLVFAGAAAEFVMLPQFGNSTFFLLALLALVDFFSGIALRTRRPRRVVATAPVVEPVVVPVPAPAPVPAPVLNREPTFTQAPVPAVVVPGLQDTAIPLSAPAPTESELHSQVEPIVPDQTAETKREADSPNIVSPGLAPGGVVSRSPDSPQR
jgi:hypothetical protein